jgi:hypothetical protein
MALEVSDQLTVEMIVEAHPMTKKAKATPNACAQNISAQKLPRSTSRCFGRVKTDIAFANRYACKGYVAADT